MFARAASSSRRRFSAALTIGIGAAWLATGCDRRAGGSEGIDAAWHRSALLDGLLVRWVGVAPEPSGAMRGAVDRRWAAAPQQPGYLTEQARLVYSFDIGYELTRDQRYLDAAQRGAEFLLTRFRDPVHGGFFTRVGADGNVVYAAKGAYGHAFVLFALSHMHRVTGDARYQAAALRTWHEVDTWPEWKPLPTRDKGGYADVGHQFEWSHMLRAAESRGLVGVYGQTADRLLQFATKVGYDEIDGGAFTAVYPDGAVNRDKHFWQQCEAVRAFLAVSAASGQPDMWRRYEQTLGLVREQFIDKTHGGWFPKACKRGDCGDAQPEPYHMTGMHAMALAMAAEAAR